MSYGKIWASIGNNMRHHLITLQLVFSILFLSAAFGDEPKCEDPAAIPVAKNLLSRLVLASTAQRLATNNLKPLEQFDFSSSVTLDNIIVVKWDDNTKIALCRASFKLDGPALMRIAVASAPQVTNMALKRFLEGLKPDNASPGFGQIAYSVQSKSGGGLSVEFLDLAQEAGQ
jgi:hypothetical protein